MRDDVIDLAALHGALDQCAGRSGPQALAPERMGNFVADLDGAVDRWSREPARADQLPGRLVDEELHRPLAVSLRRALETVQREGDGLGELGPAVRNRRADQLPEPGSVLGQ